MTACLPPQAELEALLAAIDLGHVKAVRQRLAALQESAPECGDFLARLVTLSREFQLDAMRTMVMEARDAH